MKDRISLYPGRVKLNPVAGEANTFDMVRADQPTQEGTALNKANLLSDETAALYGLGAEGTPEKVLEWIGQNNLYCWRKTSNPYTIVYGQTESTNVMSMPNYSFQEAPVKYSSEIEVSTTGIVTLKNPIEFSLSYDNYSSANILKGKYFSPSNNGTILEKIYYCESTAGNATHYMSSPWYYVRIDAKPVNVESDIGNIKWEYVFSTRKDAYPKGGYIGGEYYEFLDIPFQSMKVPFRHCTGSFIGNAGVVQEIKQAISLPFIPICVFLVGLVNGRGAFGYMQQGKSVYFSEDIGTDSTYMGELKANSIQLKYYFNENGRKTTYIAFG